MPNREPRQLPCHHPTPCACGRRLALRRLALRRLALRRLALLAVIRPKGPWAKDPRRARSAPVPLASAAADPSGDDHHHCVPLGRCFGALVVIVFRRGLYTTRTAHVDARTPVSHNQRRTSGACCRRGRAPTDPGLAHPERHRHGAAPRHPRQRPHGRHARFLLLSELHSGRMEIVDHRVHRGVKNGPSSSRSGGQRAASCCYLTGRRVGHPAGVSARL